MMTIFKFSETNEKLRVELDNSSKTKKSLGDVHQRMQSLEKNYADLTSSYQKVSEAKQKLESEVLSLQASLDVEKDAFSRETQHKMEISERIRLLQEESKQTQQKEEGYRTDVKQCHQKIVNLEKSLANVELDRDNFRRRWEAEQQAHSDTVDLYNTDKRNISNISQANEMESRDLQTKLEMEKAARHSAEAHLLETEKKNSEIGVDLIQLQHRIASLESQIQVEMDKSRSLAVQLEQEVQRRNLMQSDIKNSALDLNKAKNKERKYMKEISDLKDKTSVMEKDVRKSKEELSTKEVQMMEVQELLEAECYFSSLYKTQVKELKEELEENQKQLQDLTVVVQSSLHEKDTLTTQLQLLHTKADSEALARGIAEDQLSDVEKERTMLQLEVKEVLSRHNHDLTMKDSLLALLENEKMEHMGNVSTFRQEKDDLNNRIKKLTEDLQSSKDMSEFDKMKKQLEDEKLKKIQAVNKLAEVMNRKEFSKGRRSGRDKVGDLKKKEKDLRRAQQELTMEREKYTRMVEKMQRDIAEAQQSIYEENFMKQRLQMEMDAKDSEIEQLRQKLSLFNIDTASINSVHLEEPVDDNLSVALMEGWLGVPNRQNIKKYGWRKQFVVVSSRKVLFYSTETDKQNADPLMVLDIDKLFHVRPVTQGDVYRAEAKDVPRIFQILYAIEGENRKPDENLADGFGSERSDIIGYKGHDFLPITYRTPTHCDSCHKPVWHFLHPPPALECKRCHVKVHRDHYERKEEFIAYCKVNYDSSIQAKEMLLLAESTEKQKTWITHLSKKISKKGIVSSGNLGLVRGSKQYSSFGQQQRSQANKSSTLPPSLRNN